MIQDARIRRDIMDAAIEAYQRALEVYTEDYRFQRARVQRYLGDALMDRIPSSQRRPELYQRALAAYNDSCQLLDNLPGSRMRAEVLEAMGEAAAGLALSGEQSDALTLLGDAAEAHSASAAAFERLREPVLAGTALYRRGLALRKQADRSEGEFQLTLIATAIAAQTEALKALGRMGTNELRSQIHWELASLQWRLLPTTPMAIDERSTVCQSLREVRKHADKALNYSTEDASVARQAQKLLRDVKHRELLLECSPRVGVAARRSPSDRRNRTERE